MEQPVQFWRRSTTPVASLEERCPATVNSSRVVYFFAAFLWGVYEVESDPKVMLSILLGSFSAVVLSFFSSCSAKATLGKDAAAATLALGAFIGVISMLVMMIGKVEGDVKTLSKAEK
jgi:hypothetical protein